MGRPKKDIDLRLLREVAKLQCTDEEIAGFFKVSVDTITRRKKNPKFAQVLEQARAVGRQSVRRHMFKMAQHGNAACAIFLAKNLLGYSDKFEHTQPPDTSFRITVEYVNKAEEPSDDQDA